VGLTFHPFFTIAAASFALLLHVQRNGDVGSPRVNGSVLPASAWLRTGKDLDAG